AIGQGTLLCPLLRPNHRYVVFGGNGQRPGRGYRIAGHKGKGWLKRCGYTVPASEEELIKVVQEFLAELEGLSGPLDLVTAGLNPNTNCWLDLPQMQELARTVHGWRQLDAVHLRIYAPENYLDKWSELFLGSIIDPTQGQVAKSQAIAPAGDLWGRM